MPGSNGNSSYEDLFGEFDWQINTDKEFKKFEKTLSESGGKEDLVQACEEESSKVVAAFDAAKLDVKVAEAKGVDKTKKSTKKAMKPEVQEAYLVIGRLKDGKSWTYQELLKNAETEVTLEKAKQNLLDKINSNWDWDNLLKQSARNLIEELFAECDSIEEFERRSGSRLSAIESMDNIWDFFVAIPRTIYEGLLATNRITLEFISKIWKTAEEIKDWCKDLIEKWIIKRTAFIDRCKWVGMVMEDIARTVCGWWKDQFVSFINFLKNTWENITDALMAAWDWTWKQWNNFVELCGWAWEDVKEFWIMLVEKWELLWTNLVEWLGNAWDKVEDLCKTLIEKWLVKIGEFADWCVWLGEKWKELIISIIDWNVNLWNDFAEFCKDKWETMKDFFATVATELLRIWKITLEKFWEWCKGSWEVVKDVVCNILVWLVKAWKFALDAVADVLIVVVWVPVMVAYKLLVLAWKAIYKSAEAVANFVSNLSVVLREKAKQLWISAADFLKQAVNVCKELAWQSAEFVSKLIKWLWEALKDAWIKAADFIRATYEVVKWALKNAWNSTAEFFRKLWLKIEDIAVTLWEVSKWLWKWCIDFVVKSYKDFKVAMNVLVNKCKMGIDKIWEAIVQAGTKLVEFINYVKELGKITFDNISKWCKWEWKKITMFIKTAIESAKVTWQNLVDRCWWQIDKIAVALREIYGKTTDKIREFIKFTWKVALEAWKLLLKLWIWTVWLVMLALKELSCWLKDVAELFVKYGKLATKALCDLLSNVYGKSKDMIVSIWKYVAGAMKNAAKDIRDWVYAKTNDVKRAIEATKEYISNWVKDIAEWMYKKWIQVKDICRTIYEEFRWEYQEMIRWLKDFARSCAIWWNVILENLKIDI